MGTEKNNNLSLEIVDADPKIAEERIKHFPFEKNGFIHVGPGKYFFPIEYKELAADIYNVPLRPDDVFVVTYPRSGKKMNNMDSRTSGSISTSDFSVSFRQFTLVWLVANDLDYETSAAVTLTKRYPFLEISMFTGMEPDSKVEITELASIPSIEQVAAAPSPRFIKTHLPLSLLPPKLLDTAKVVYVARDPRDVAVSFYHFNKTPGIYVGNFKTYWNYFIRDLLPWSPFFEHLKEAWEKRHHPNLLFLFYEDLCKDLPAEVHRVAAFFNKELNKEQVAKLCDHLSIDNFKNNKSVNNALKELGLDVNPEQGIIRKGKVGGWRDYFDADMTREADNWIADNLKDTDFRFPHLAT